MTDPQPTSVGGDDASRAILVTGASSGIGLATAQRLALAGHRVVLGARRSEVCEEAAAKLRATGATAFAVPLDLTDATSIGQFVESSRALIGPLDVVVSNAGNSWPTPSADINAARLRDTFDVNFMGPQQLVAHALPAMIDSGQGDLIFVSSEVVGGTPRTWMSAYTASKHALEAWIAVLRNELEGTGVRASIVRPGPTRTEQGTNWSVEEMQLMRTGWHGPGGIRHAGTLQPDDVARVITSVVELPGNVHMRLVEVVPAMPRNAEAQG